MGVVCRKRKVNRRNNRTKTGPWEVEGQREEMTSFLLAKEERTLEEEGHVQKQYSTARGDLLSFHFKKKKTIKK